MKNTEKPLNRHDPRGRKAQVAERAVFLTALASTALVALNPPFLQAEPLGWRGVTLGVTIGLSWLAVLVFLIRRFMKRLSTDRPRWPRYLWPIAFLVLVAALTNRSDLPSSTGEGIGLATSLVFGLYGLAILVITIHVQRLMHAAKKRGYPYSREDYRRALRTARTICWLLPVFAIAVFISLTLLEENPDLAAEGLTALQNQLYGVIGASAIIAAFTAVPSETTSIQDSFQTKQRLRKLEEAAQKAPTPTSYLKFASVSSVVALMSASLLHKGSKARTNERHEGG